MVTILDIHEHLAYSILRLESAEFKAKIKIVAIAIYWLRHEQKAQKALDLQTKAVEIIGKNCSHTILLIHQEIDSSLEKAFSVRNGIYKYRGRR
ncbi:MAG: hypothetical protein ChlgKO_09540 [Chlamydiales bacterium]